MDDLERKLVGFAEWLTIQGRTDQAANVLAWIFLRRHVKECTEAMLETISTQVGKHHQQ